MARYEYSNASSSCGSSCEDDEERLLATSYTERFPASATSQNKRLMGVSVGAVCFAAFALVAVLRGGNHAAKSAAPLTLTGRALTESDELTDLAADNIIALGGSHSNRPEVAGNASSAAARSRRLNNTTVTQPSAAHNICLKGRLVPSLYLIGAQKCGTATLFVSLNLSESIFIGGQKELHLFDMEPKDWKAYDTGRVLKKPKLTLHGGHFREWWDRWPGCKEHEQKVAFDGTVRYLADPRAPHRMASWYGSRLSKKLQFVVSLREPLSRMQSSFHFKGREWWPRWRDHGVRTLPENESEAFKAYTEYVRNGTWGCLSNVRGSKIDERCWFFQKSLYAIQLARWFEQFDSRQFLVIPFDAIKGARARQTTVRILQRAGLSEKLRTPKTDNIHRHHGDHGSLEKELGSAGVEDMRKLFAETGNSPWAVARVLAESNAELAGYAGEPGDVDAILKWLQENW